MSITGLRLDSTEEFVSDLDENKGTDGEVTVWVLGTLSSRVLTYLRDKSTSFSTNKDGEISATFAPFSSAYETTRIGLRGWKNFKDTSGGDIPFHTVSEEVAGVMMAVVAPACMDILPVELIRELSEQITGVNSVTETDAGNSDG